MATGGPERGDGAEKAGVWAHQMSGLAKSMEESKIDPDWDEREQSENPGCAPIPATPQPFLPLALPPRAALNPSAPNPTAAALFSALPVMKNRLAEDTSKFTDSDATNTVTHKLFKKGERLYREGSYTLWRDNQNDYYVAYAADDRNSSIMDDVRASVRGGKESLADNTVNAKAQVLKIMVTNEARLEFDIYTQEVWLHAPVPVPPDRPVTSCFLNSTLSPRRPCGRCAPRGEHISMRFVPHHDCVEPRNRRAPCAHTRQGRRCHNTPQL